MKWIFSHFLVAVLLLSGGCNNIVPQGEAAAFARKQAARAWYKSLTGEFVYFRTDAGDFAVQLMPLKNQELVQHVRQLVQDGYYTGLRFHRAITRPIPFGVQVGDPLTRGQHGRDFLWEGQVQGFGSLPIAGRNPGPVIEGSYVSEFPYIRGAVSLAANENGTELSSHLFFHLGKNNFIANRHPVIGFVRYGQNTLDHLQLGSRIEQASLLSLQEFPATLTSMETPLPRTWAQRVKGANPDVK